MFTVFSADFRSSNNIDFQHDVFLKFVFSERPFWAIVKIALASKQLVLSFSGGDMIRDH